MVTKLNEYIRYTDLMGEATAGLYGHSNPIIITAMNEVFARTGVNLGATHRHEEHYATALCERFHMERVGFANSGTEANLFAIAAARAYTKKKRVVVASGAYHGGVMLFAGGVPAACNVDIDSWIVGRYNDVESIVQAIQQDDVAAVLIEAMQGGPPGIPATQEFMNAVESTARKVSKLPLLSLSIDISLALPRMQGQHG